MQPNKLLGFLLFHGVAVGLGATVATSCIEVAYPTVAFRCDPGEDKACPDGFFCCSDDPAAEGGQLPAYEGYGIQGGTPYFSAVNNADSTSGMCVRTDEIPASGALQEQAAFRCPIPCNPTWDSGDIAMVCGADRVCCQTVELGPNDCITVDGVRRPVTGADAPQYTQWRGAEHDTHQNPTGKICEKYGAANSTTWRDCVDQLSVANQRGFCMQLDEGQQCPAETIADPCAGAAEGGA